MMMYVKYAEQHNSDIYILCSKTEEMAISYRKCV